MRVAYLALAPCLSDRVRVLRLRFLRREMKMKRGLLVVSAALALSGCGYNDFQSLDEQTKSAWSEVLNQYQRRADLVPNIVATVKGEAAFEQGDLDQGD